MGDVRPSIYFPMRPANYARPSVRGVTLMVRAAPGVDAISVVRREISAIDTDLTPFDPRGMPEQIEQFMSPLKMATWTYGVIGVFGLILASAGLAGVTAYSVTQRGHEIGIRIALGARSGDVLRLVMKEGAALIAAGTVMGLGGAWGGIRLLSSVSSPVAKSIGASASDPVLLVGGPLLMTGVALAACYLPARRSVRIDPAVALRQE